MPECELCGVKVKSPVKARISDVLLHVCLECAKSGTIIDAPEQPIMRQEMRTGGPEEVLILNYSQVIRAVRQKTELTQEDFAIKLNEKASVIHAAESGKRLDLNLAKKIEKTFGVKLTEVV